MIERRTPKTRDNWRSPYYIIEFAQEILEKIDLDPCASPAIKHHFATTNWTGYPDNGLNLQWYGNAFINPPYGSQIKHWINKSIEEHESPSPPNQILLLPCRPGSKWFDKITKAGKTFAVPDHRLHFDAEGPAPFPSMLILLTKAPRLDRRRLIFSFILNAKRQNWSLYRRT